MDILTLKEEWIIKCNNCGFDSHCAEPLKRPEKQWQDPDTLMAWNIEVCKQCRCKACAA
jgi:hypothetical protein